MAHVQTAGRPFFDPLQQRDLRADGVREHVGAFRQHGPGGHQATPETLKELRAAFAASDPEVHLKDYLDLHPIGDMLLHIGFYQPVMNAEWVTLTYRSLHGLWEDLKGTGSDVLDEDQLSTVAAAYDAMRVDDLYPATYEINFGMAEKRAEQPVKNGEVAIPVSAIQGRK